MAYQHQHNLSATFVPGMDDFYMPAAAPELQAPKPDRINPEMPNQIADGLKHMDINANIRPNTMSPQQPAQQWQQPSPNNGPHLSPFPKIVNPPANVPPSDDELEATLENARPVVLNSNDPEMQLAWAADALIYVGVCADNEERIAAAKPHAARPATPRIEHQLREDAMNIVTFLADQHHPKAEFLRGMWLEWGRFGQREDKKEAFRCYSRAADKQYARAEYRIGMLYESYNDPAKALRHYHRGVDAGDAASCYRLGMMTLRGQHGQQQDFKAGIELIRKSAEGADENAAQGAYVYGMLLARQLPQIEVPEGYLELDERKARMNIEKAAYLKFAKAQLKMGSAYELASLGCEFNPSLSIHYNALASKQGEAEADMSLSKWFLVGSEGLFPKNEELAYTYAERAAQSGLATAEFALGYFHEIGMYVPVNLDKALEWYQKASNHGNTDATGRIDGLAKKQVLSRKDHEQVAISKIKSQYGSMRGSRPERFQQQQKPSRLGQSTTIDDMSQAYNNAAAGQMPPPRGASITPYPENDGPPRLPPDNRSQSVAPYPLEDGPPKGRLGPAGGFFNVSQPPRPSTTLNPDVRPSSAFQINPDLRPNSFATPPSYAGRPDYHGGGPAPGVRPATTQPYDARPTTTQPYDPRLRPPPNRVASGPPVGQNFPPQQGRPSPAPQRPPMQQQISSPAAPQHPAPSPGPALDIGFTAPYDDRRNRQYGPQSQRPIQPSGGQKPYLQNSSSMPVAKPAPLATSKPPSKTPEARKPSSQSGAPNPPAKSSTAPAKPPGKGPKTFDEMGVPAQQKDGDCVMM